MKEVPSIWDFNFKTLNRILRHIKKYSIGTQNYKEPVKLSWYIDT